MTSEQASSEIPQRRVGAKRKRETPSSRLAEKRKNSNSTPDAYSRRSPPRQPLRDPSTLYTDGRKTLNRQRESTSTPSPERDVSPPRKLKRPGGGSRLKQQQQEQPPPSNSLPNQEDAAKTQAAVTVVRDHYNAVPERGREWRSTESKIAGLRSLNNWIKSTLIQKFSRPDIPVANMKCLDMACGKGGDLGKWKKAPQVPVLYVGCDIANVSIEDARKRYEEDMQKSRGRQPRMHAEFFVHDTFAHSLSDIPIINHVGFNPNAGPGPMIIQGGMMTGGFDVVSMMFALHYSFESEDLARGMLKNVAGALKKGGRFIGVMPNSDFISEKVRSFMPVEKGSKQQNVAEDGNDDWDPEKPSEVNGDAEDDWDPEKPSEPSGDAEDDWNPEKPSEVQQDTDLGPIISVEWKNDIYCVRFPADRRLPADGIFRPPFGWLYHYHLEEAVQAPEYVVPWEAFRALAEEYGLELLYRKGFKEVFEDESTDRELGELAKRMKVVDYDGKLRVSEQEMEAASFYHAFCFYKT